MKTNHSALLLLVFMFLVFMPGCSDAQDVPLEVREGMWNGKTTIDVVSLVDNITVTALYFNRKEVPAHLIHVPRTLGYGEAIQKPWQHNAVREVQVVTDKGTYTFQLR